MWNPVTALIWESWRKSRSWVLVIMVIAFVAVQSLFVISNARMPDFETTEGLKNGAAMSTMALLLIFSSLSTLNVGSMKGKGTLPFATAFKLPVSSTVLVVVPVLYLGVACASIYIVPAVIFNFIYGFKLPIFPVLVFFLAAVAALAACGWSSSRESIRVSALSCAYFGLVYLVSWFQEGHLSSRVDMKLPVLSPVNLSLSFINYLFLFAALAMALLMTLYFISRQRCGGDGLMNLTKTILVENKATNSVKPVFTIIRLKEKLDELFPFQCPVDSPLKAEAWLEMKQYGMFNLFYGLSFSLLVPFLMFSAGYFNLSPIFEVGYRSPEILFLVCIGAPVFNRRTKKEGFMNAFEAARGLTTVQLMAVQILVLTLTTLLAVVMTTASIYLSLPLVKQFIEADQSSIIAFFTGEPLMILFAKCLAVVVCFTTVLGFYSCLHSYSIIWRRKFLLVVAVLVLYAIRLAILIFLKEIEFEFLQLHFWVFVAAVLLATALAFRYILVEHILSVRRATAAFILWGFFLVCAVITLNSMDINLMEMDSASLALHLTIMFLPYSIFVQLVYCYDRLRHG